MKKRKIKKTVLKKTAIVLSAIVLITTISITIKISKYHKTSEYKLKQIGYNKEEITKILKLDQDNLEYVIQNDYNEYIDDLMNEKYYIEKNLQRYIKYQQENKNKNISEIISLVNVNKDNEEYTNTKKADISKKELILVNKYNYLEKEYEPENIKKISSRYAYDDNYAPEEALNKYKKMFEKAEEDGMDLIISSSYRSYEEQEETYNFYEKEKGEEKVKKYASLPGYSEHQTGFAFDILTTGVMTDDFETTKEFKWLQENAYKYGFILRYPKDKEEITGYDYESWHYRYVGESAAKKIKEENITFDEFYAYYVENRQ
jgi:D-alanyl-D-alanine carboxypeptidase